MLRSRGGATQASVVSQKFIYIFNAMALRGYVKGSFTLLN